MKKTIIILGLSAFIIAFLALISNIYGLGFFSGEDSWICDNGEWVKHGNPSASKPTTLCPEAKLIAEDPSTSLRASEEEQLIGGDKDEHGCLIAAGYSWCQIKQKCLRVWEEGCDITIDSPQPEDTIISPLAIKGEAFGGWYFEENFPIILKDLDGNTIAQATAVAQDVWMADDFVPFEANLEFDAGTTTQGRLIFKKDNPSGLLENDFEVRVLVNFQ